MPELELKPCPFCGWDILVYQFVPESGRKWGRVECTCGACGPDVRTSYKDIDHWAQEAAEAWNERCKSAATGSLAVL